jgi:hypothetical protein
MRSKAKRSDNGVDDVNRLEQPKARPRNAPPQVGMNFTEAAGKVVAFVNVINDPPDWQALEIRFTDGTLLHFELQASHVKIKAEYMEARRGDLELIRSYRVLQTDDAKDGD